ncbi:MAG: L,D-transpeptidase family protein [Allosphingosinicella sp.]
MPKNLRLSALALLLATPTMPGAIQAAAFAQSEPRLGYQNQVPPAATTVPAATPVAPAPQPVVWRPRAAEELLRYVEEIGKEGLDPASYQPERLREALASGDQAALNAVANATFLRLSADLSGGYVRGDGRVDWHMPDSAIDGNRQQLMLAQASQGGAPSLLNELLPTHSQYLGLRQVLALTPESDEARRELIRANMERWRWMPRDLGPRHVIVNVPAFTAAIVDEGRVTTRHRVIVGARRTPTPQLVSNAVAVTMNPWWNVPQSIIREMGGRFGGYQVRRGDGGAISVRQPPGPRNALGRLKIEMPNDHAIYLHDTPAQALFERPVRAFSHGCIRTQHVRDFAAQLLAPTGQWDRAAIDQAIAGGETTRAELAAPVPVYIAYFTAAATNDGTIVTYADIYGRDAPVRQALNRAAPGAAAQQSTID